MVLIDFNPVVIAAAAMAAKHFPDQNNINTIRHLFLNSIGEYRRMYKSKYGDEFVICCDGKNIWRKNAFPYYKVKRKELKDNSALDFDLIHKAMDVIREEMDQFFPYPVIHLDNAEADDIIATLTLAHAPQEPVMILSPDHDFVQLQRAKNVFQYNIIQKREVKHRNPKEVLVEKLIRGDRKDGVPNILSDDDVFAVGKRQTPIRQNKFDQYVDPATGNVIVENMEPDVLRRYERNVELIDLDEIPTEISDQIIEEYEDAHRASRSGLLTYFINKRLKNLMQNIQDY